MNWFQRLSKTGRMEKELDAELRFHFESQVADKIRGRHDRSRSAPRDAP